MTFGSLKPGFLHGEQSNLDVDAKREIPFSKTVGGRESRSEELRCGRKHAQTYLDFVRVPPVLLEYALDCHVARQDHHFVVIVSARQLTLLT